MIAPKQLLIIINNTQAAQQAAQLLEGSCYQTTTVNSCQEAHAIIETKRLDAILLGSSPQSPCLLFMETLRESVHSPAVIALLDTDEQDRYLACHKEGALDCLGYPFNADRLIKSIERCLAIKSLEREKRDFISMLSHDLKNPLTAAIGSIDLVREKRLGAVNKEQVSYLNSAIESCNEVVTMIDNLLDLHRFEAGKISLNKTPVDLAELTNQVIGSFKGIIRQARIQLHIKITENLPILMLDRHRFSRVISNLISNAIKFTPSGGELSVSCCKGISEDSKLAVLVIVKDTGSGIPQEELSSIFDRFIQTRNQSGRGSGGSGLSLAFCKLTVQAHNGQISADSNHANGNTFTITLPIPDDQTEDI